MRALSARDSEASFALALLDLPSFGARKTLDGIERYGSAEAAYERATSSNAPSRISEFVKEHPLFDYEGVLSRTRELGGDFKIWTDEDYPANLSQWQGRPPVLFYKGNLSGLARRSLALVGRVDPSERGVDAANRFARLCVEHEISVVSGLAKGIDGASHRGALEDPPGNTYAVVAHGLDFAYPAENRDLYASIPEHGAVISQFATGTGPQRWTFPARNEVMCTLALGTVIVEAKEGCGSIIQADFSFKHGRPVFILSKNLKSGDTEWARKLVKRGAHVIEHFEQVLEIVERAHGELWDKPAPIQPMFEMEDMTSASAPRAAIFDLDGVVIDSRAATTRAIAAIATRHTGREIHPDTIKASQAPHKALQDAGVSNAWNVYTTEYDTAFAAEAEQVGVFDQMIAAIQQLREDGFLVAAVTSQPRRRIARMLPAEMQAHFQPLLASGEYPGKKDAGIQKVLRGLGVERENAVFVGDTASDLEAARKAGVKSVAVLWGFSTEADLDAWRPDEKAGTPRDAYNAIHRLTRVS
ncbi:HAD-IA family hydrolase [Microbacterium paraoxydans]|uniref:HAD-IA family hydrolase n=1 Tax=Microbacterium paraoxydans TaxID=199592 RepID=UPI0022862B1C|nr:HAD-IA family hydrolase [Microbacterium paraoxydans]MCZ0710580.1 HAD-IA family hydrolase [Microbacterium paraoxydans]